MISFIDLSLIGLNIFSWSFFPFINKHLLQNIDPISYTIIRWVISIPIALVASLFFKDIYTQKFNFYIIVFFLLLISFITSNIQNYLLKKYDANLIAAVINPLVIFLTAIIGTLFFNEPFTNQMWFGFFIILIGLIIFLLGKK